MSEVEAFGRARGDIRKYLRVMLSDMEEERDALLAEHDMTEEAFFDAVKGMGMNEIITYAQKFKKLRPRHQRKVDVAKQRVRAVTLCLAMNKGKTFEECEPSHHGSPDLDVFAESYLAPVWRKVLELSGHGHWFGCPVRLCNAWVVTGCLTLHDLRRDSLTETLAEYVLKAEQDVKDSVSRRLNVRKERRECEAKSKRLLAQAQELKADYDALLQCEIGLRRLHFAPLSYMGSFQNEAWKNGDAPDVLIGCLQGEMK